MFPPGTVERGPKSRLELDAKTEILASVIGRFFDNRGPDLMGFAEAGNRNILDGIVRRLSPGYVVLWEPCARYNQSGLGVIWRPELISDLSRVDGECPSMLARPRTLVSDVRLRQTGHRFLFCVVHWKSRLQNPRGTPFSDAEERMNSARWLADLLGSHDRGNSTILIGDFNAEPIESPFFGAGLRASRHFGRAIWGGTASTHLYNTAWRFLCEPDYWENTQIEGFREKRPKTSFGRSEKLILDQLLVSGRLLKNGPLRLREASIRFHLDTDTAEFTKGGRIRAKSWHYEAITGSHSGASDHMPLLAEFELVHPKPKPTVSGSAAGRGYSSV